MAEENKADRAKRKTFRSPNYPYLSLQEALEKARGIYAQEKRTYTSPSVLQAHMGYTASTGPAGRALSALKQYGLLDEKDGQYRISDAAFSILQLSDASSERKAEIKEAALKPAIFRDLIENYKGSLPSDLSLRDYLIKTKKFNPDSVASFITIFRETVNLAFNGETSDTRNTEDEILNLPPMDDAQKQEQEKTKDAPYFRFTLNGATVEFRASAPLSKEHFALIDAHLKALNPDKGTKDNA